MTEHDKGLIAKAKALRFTEWYVANELATKADTDEARKLLLDIAARLYHEEEYYAGLL